MKFLIVALTILAQAPAFAASDCTSSARTAAQGMVTAASQSMNMRLSLDLSQAPKISDNGTYRFSVISPQSSYILDVEMNESCFPTAVKWPFLN